MLVVQSSNNLQLSTKFYPNLSTPCDNNDGVDGGNQQNTPTINRPLTSESSHQRYCALSPILVTMMMMVVTLVLRVVMMMVIMEVDTVSMGSLVLVNALMASKPNPQLVKNNHQTSKG